jgi:hypothetical protein
MGKSCQGVRGQSRMIRHTHRNQALQGLGVFRAAGATEFILQMFRTFHGQCNEEFTRKELQMLAALDCHFFYVARDD